MIGRLVTYIDPVTRGWAVVAAGSAVRLGLGFVASIIIARSLGPEVFAVFAILAAASGLAGAMADFGLSDAGVRRIAESWSSDPVEAASRGRAFFWLRTAAAAVLTAAGILFAAPISAHLLGLAEPPLLALALVGVLATALGGAVNSMLQASGRFESIATVIVANSGLTALLAAVLAVLGALNLVTALVVLGIGTSLTSFAIGWRLLPAPLSLRLPSGLLLRNEAAQLIPFGFWLWIGGILAILAIQLDLLLVNRWLEPAIVGMYGLAMNLAAKVDVANHSLHTALLPAAAALKGSKAVRSYLRRGLVRSSLLAILFLPLFPLAGPLIGLFYGPAFAPAAPIFQLLLAVALFDLFATPLTLLAFTYDRPRLLAGAEGARAATVGLAGLWLIPTLGPAGAVAARFASRVVGVAVIVMALSRVREPGFEQNGQDR